VQYVIRDLSFTAYSEWKLGQLLKPKLECAFFIHRSSLLRDLRGRKFRPGDLFNRRSATWFPAPEMLCPHEYSTPAY
jgi:hypothetical protein